MLFSISDKDQSITNDLEHNNLVGKLRQLEMRRMRNADNFELNILQEDIKLSTIKQQLNPKSGLVSYMNTDQQLIGIYLDQDTTIFFSKVLDGNELEDMVNSYRNSIEKEVRLSQEIFDNYIFAAHNLYDILVQPFESRLSEIDQLVVIPDEAIGNIPFEAFISEANKTDKINFRKLPYLLQQVQMVYTSSWKVYQNNQNRIISNFQGQTIGFWTTPELQASNGLEKIKKSVEKGFVDNEIFSQSAGGKAIFQHRHRNFDILHLLLHASSSKNNRYNNHIRFGNNKN
ncbi:MAG: CHAT domain-containing protein, partial [Bacteroidota bacterium]